MRHPTRIFSLTLMALFLAVVQASAAAKVKGESTYKPYEPIVLKASDVTSTKAQFLWDVEGDARYVEAGDTLYVWAKPGEYRVTLTAVDFDAKKIERARFSFKVEGKVDPKPPGPGPDPDPDPEPDPDPDEKPAPIPLAGFRVLIVYESEELADLPAAQVDAMYSKSVRDFLNAKCATGKDGKTREWRVWDKDVKLGNEEKHWQDAMKRPRTSLPWVLISNGDTKKGYEGPLPKHTEELMILLRKYAGN